SLWDSANCAWAAATPACAARSELSWSCGSSLPTTWSGSSRSPTLAARSIMRPPMRKARRVSFSASIRPVNATVSPLSCLTTVTVRTGRTSGGAVSVSGWQAASIAVAKSRSEKRDPIACPKHADIPLPRFVFLHGNPTPSYLWRNIIPYLLPFGRCLAPDYVGMGNSGTAPSGSCRLVDHQRYLDAWFEAMGINKNVILVVHDWGSALGFSWAQRHPEGVKAIVYMEAIVRPFFSWDEWPETTRAFFQAQRTPTGEGLILQKNLFIEYLSLPNTRFERTDGATRQGSDAQQCL